MRGPLWPTLENRGQLPARRCKALQEALLGLHSLDEVLRWGMMQRPPAQFVEVVIQDEYNHDVIMALDEHYHLVFDTT